MLTEIANGEEVAARDRVAAVGTLSKVMGYDAPTRIEQVTIVASLESWLDATERRERAALQQQLAPGSPPSDARAEAISAPPNISQNSANESGR